MIVELREYQLKPEHSVDRYVDLYRQKGFDLQTRILGGLTGAYMAEVGDLNKLMMLWRYADIAERDERRRELAGHQQWRDFVGEVTPMFATMKNSLLRPTTFCPEIK